MKHISRKPHLFGENEHFLASLFYYEPIFSWFIPIAIMLTYIGSWKCMTYAYYFLYHCFKLTPQHIQFMIGRCIHGDIQLRICISLSYPQLHLVPPKSKNKLANFLFFLYNLQNLSQLSRNFQPNLESFLLPFPLTILKQILFKLHQFSLVQPYPRFHCRQLVGFEFLGLS